MHGLAPLYIIDLLAPYEPSHCLRSSDGTLLTVPTARHVTKGNRGFSVKKSQCHLLNHSSKPTFTVRLLYSDFGVYLFLNVFIYLLIYLFINK